MESWHPSATLDNLRARASVLASVRDFFALRGVLEVDTPVLSRSAATDLHLQSIEVPGVFTADQQSCYLQTSPEFAMKRLLAAGSGAIYQICKAFRQDERSPRHNPEFTMLEWYRPGFDEQQLMDEVDALVREVTGLSTARRLSYRELFQQYLGIDPHCAGRQQLLQLTQQYTELSDTDYSQDDLLQLLLALAIEPQLVDSCFVTDFPASMAALARTAKDSKGVLVARRFELFVRGMEIANGYFELIDPVEQRARFEQDLRQRKKLGRPALPIDEQLLAALEHGIPSCAGVALGLDRLVMLVTGAERIDDVVSFCHEKSASNPRLQ